MEVATPPIWKTSAFGWDLTKDATGKVVDEAINEDEAKIIRESADRLLLGASPGDLPWHTAADRPR